MQTGADADGIHLWLVLWKAYSAVREYAARDIAALGIGLSDFAILERILNKGPAAVNEIGTSVGLTSGSMTIAIDRLEKRGLVERRSTGDDRRSRIVHLTARGRVLIEPAFEAHSLSVECTLRGTDRERACRGDQSFEEVGRAAERCAAESAC